MSDFVTWVHDSAIVFLPKIQQWLYGTKDDPGHGVSIVFILVIGSIAYFVGQRLLIHTAHRVVRSTRHRDWHKKDVEKRQRTLTDLFTNIWRIIILCLVTYSIMKEFVPDLNTILTPLFASAGIIGVALGFGAQSVIKDFLSGIFIISENQYRVGDIVDIEGAVGTVERIGSRSTVLRDVDGNVHYLPNGMVQHVINKTMGYSMARFVLAVDPATDIDTAATIINSTGTALADEEKWKSKIIEAPAFVSVGDMTGTSVELIIAGKTQPSDQWAVIAEMRRRLLDALDKKHVKLAVIPPVGMAHKNK
ncbi:MAG: mechanosensitive ion channel domain-containing protein [Candidatus Saccharimonadales bacterium]